MSKNISIYLAGPIDGQTVVEANGWRDNMIYALSQNGIVGVSPLRCEPCLGEVYGTGNDDPRFGTPRAIASKNFLDVSNCDMTLCYFPKEAVKVSLGTVVELAWAWSMRKPTILVSEDPRVTGHPVLQANASWVVGTLGEALEIIEGVFSVYANPKFDRRTAIGLNHLNQVNQACS